jgi:hypothetical protein
VTTCLVGKGRRGPRQPSGGTALELNLIRTLHVNQWLWL